MWVYNNSGKRYLMRKSAIKIGISFLIIVLSSCASRAPSVNSGADMSGENTRASRGGESGNDSRMIAYTVNIQISVNNVEETRKTLTEKIEDFDGFITRESDNQITSRIPVEHMEEFLGITRTLGKVESESKTGVDITDQYRDNVIRLENLRNLRSRYLELLHIAETVADLLSIEKELERVNTEIEIMEGRIQYAQMSVAYSNITVRFNERVRPGPFGLIFYGLYLGIKWLFVWD
jgi:hypothetical protein